MVSDKEIEFVPCKKFDTLENKYKNSFRYCYQKIHHLSYYPTNTKLKCCDVLSKVNDFLESVNACIVLYKGGCLEKRICEQLGIECYNIEYLGAPKVNSHSPKVEINAHYNFLLNIGCMFQLPRQSHI